MPDQSVPQVLNTPDSSPDHLSILKKLYSIGLLEEQLYELLTMSMKTRNSLVHGLAVSGIDARVVRELVDTVRRGLKEAFK